MVVLKARLGVEAGSREPFLARMAELVRASLGEPGCLGFGCYEEAWSPGAFLVLGEWADRAALGTHERSPHVAAFKSAAGGMVSARWPAQVYDVAHVADLGA